MREISGLPAGLLDCQDGFCPMQSATCSMFTGQIPVTFHYAPRYTKSKVKLKSTRYFTGYLDWLLLSPSFLAADIIL